MRIVLGALLIGTSFGQAVGTWKMNPAKSKMAGCPCPRSMTIKTEAAPEGEVLTIYKVGENGASQTYSLILYLDGKDHEAAGLPDFDAVKSARTDPQTVEIVFKKKSGVVSRSLLSASVDGKRMTFEIWHTGFGGQQGYRFLVLEKQ